MLACGEGHSLFVDPDGIVWASGLNNYGQLGLGHTQNQRAFCRINGVPRAVKVSTLAESNHSAILDHQGDIWMFGKNNSSQTGTDCTKQTVILSPTKVQNLPKIIMVSCGYNHSIVLDSTKSIWGVGDNSYGQLSYHEGAKKINKFTRINTPDEMGRVVKVNCGFSNSICQSETKELWVTGHNPYGQLCAGHTRNVNSFQRISSRDDIRVQSFGIGRNHTVILDVNGGAWSAGFGGNGQLGLGHTQSKSALTKIPNIPLMVQVACGECNTLMVDANGAVYVCGYNVDGQLGTGSKTGIVSPKMLPELSGIKQASLSGKFSMIVDDGGRLWASGDNCYRQHRTDKFTLIEGAKVNAEEEANNIWTRSGIKTTEEKMKEFKKLTVRSKSKETSNDCKEIATNKAAKELMSGEWEMAGWHELVEDAEDQVITTSSKAKILAGQIKEDEERAQQLQQELAEVTQGLKERRKELKKLEDKQEALEVLIDTLTPVFQAEEQLQVMIEEVKVKKASMWSVEDVNIFLLGVQLNTWCKSMRDKDVDGETLVALVESKNEGRKMIREDFNLRDWKRLQYHTSMGKKCVLLNKRHDAECPICKWKTEDLTELLEEYQVEGVSVEQLAREGFTVKELIMVELEDIASITGIESLKTLSGIQKNISAMKKVRDRFVKQMQHTSLGKRKRQDSAKGAEQKKKKEE